MHKQLKYFLCKYYLYLKYSRRQSEILRFLKAKLFQVALLQLWIHLKNIFEEGELDESSTCKDFLQVQKEGKREVKRNQKLHNPDSPLLLGEVKESDVVKEISEPSYIDAQTRLMQFLVRPLIFDVHRMHLKINLTELWCSCSIM